MANRSREFHIPPELLHDEPELPFDLTFGTQDVQSPVGSIPNLSHGSFDHFVAHASAPVPITGGHSAARPMERMTSMGGLQGFATGWPAWSIASSPTQPLSNSFESQSNHPSPMLSPFVTHQASSSLNEHLTAFSVGSAPAAMETQSNGAGISLGGVYNDQMSRDELSSLFLGTEMMPAVLHSPMLHAHGSDPDAWTVPMDFTPNSSPSQFLQAGSMFGGSSPAMGSVLPASPSVSPLVIPQSAATESIPNLDLAMLPGVGVDQHNAQVSPVDATNHSSNLRSPNASLMHFEADGSRSGRVLPARKLSGSRKANGRKGPLQSRAREKAGKMRLLGACVHCRARKSSCDDGIYCRSCIRHFGVQVLRSPCRGKVLSDLTEGLMRGNIFPTHRTLEHFLPDGNKRTAQEYPVKVVFGFGPSIAVNVRVIIPNGDRKENLTHNHLMYQWPLGTKQLTERRQYKHEVFPAVVSDEAQMRPLLEEQLTVLVEKHFESFPRHRSQLDVLPSIHKFYKMIPAGKVRDLLGNCLRLLVLVHIGGDFQMDATDPSSRNLYAHLLKDGYFTAGGSGDCPGNFETCPRDLDKFPLPCFIRGQFGKVMPQLANELMANILRELELLCLSQKCEVWVPVLAAFAVIIMTVESIDYHAQKINFHASLDHGATAAAAAAAPAATSTTTRLSLLSAAAPFGPAAAASAASAVPAPGDLLNTAGPAFSEQAFNLLVRFYRACFSSCHSRLTDASSATRRRSNSAAAAAVAASGQKEAQTTLLAELRAALGAAGQYLAEKGSDTRATSDDLSFFFDRKLAIFFMNVEFGM